MTKNKDKSMKDIVDSVKNKADELYNKPLPLTIPKDKHGGINILPIIGILIVVIIILVLINWINYFTKYDIQDNWKNYEYSIS